jgi:glycine cleavage system H lipoate-binding protein
MGHEFLSIYPAKLMEYVLAVSYLLLFIPFWRYVQGGRKAERAAEVRVAPAARAEVAAPAPRPAGAVALPRPAGAGWFHAPPGVHVHPGHAWARLEPDGLVTVGLDEFAHKLVGPATVQLPAMGTKVAQGEPSVEIGDEEKTVGLVSPVDGTVVAVNATARERPEVLDDPYGAGWLFKVKAPRLAANLRQLFHDVPAQRLLDEAGEALALRVSPEIGHVLQDGGAPVHGIARALAGDEWDTLARSFLLT